MSDETPICAYHKKVGSCYTRPPYRDGKRKRAVKVFTIADESLYLIFFGVPSLGLEQNLKDRVKKIHPPVLLKKLDYPNVEYFTEAILAKFECVNAARRVKTALDDSSFYGGQLHIVYAPEYETVAECRLKLHTFRRYNELLAMKSEKEMMNRLAGQSTLPWKSTPVTQIASSCSDKATISEPNSISTTPDIIFNSTALNPYSLNQTGAKEKVQLFAPPESSGDALSDSRKHWAALGYNFCIGKDDETSEISRRVPLEPRKEYNNLSQTNSLKRPVPEAVQQALSCRQSLDYSCTKKSPRIQSPLLQQSCEVLTDSSTSSSCRANLTTVARSVTDFLPRSLQKCRPILRVGELKRIALQMGPVQGPRLPVHFKVLKDIEGDSASTVNTKRLVFHR